jgi:hypothetical protein
MNTKIDQQIIVVFSSLCDETYSGPYFKKGTNKYCLPNRMECSIGSMGMNTINPNHKFSFLVLIHTLKLSV